MINPILVNNRFEHLFKKTSASFSIVKSDIFLFLLAIWVRSRVGPVKLCKHLNQVSHPSFNSFIYLICEYGLWFWIYSFCIIHYCHCLFNTYCVPDLSSVSSWVGFCFTWMFTSFSEWVIAFWHRSHFRFILYFPCPGIISTFLSFLLDYDCF